MNKPILCALILIVASIALNIYVYPLMPERMISHWNFYGNPDGYSSRLLGLLIMPVISVILIILFLVIPLIDPLKKNIKEFRHYFDWFIFFITLFLSYINLLVILANLGFSFNMNYVLPPAFALLFFYAGILTENAKRNWFIGIRTPWTLSSEKVWSKTNKLGGKLFKISGIICLLGLILPEYSIFFLLIPSVFTAVYTILYSYLEYRKQSKKK